MPKRLSNAEQMAKLREQFQQGQGQKVANVFLRPMPERGESASAAEVLAAAAAEEVQAPPAQPQTLPGVVLELNQQLSETRKSLEAAERELAQWDGALPVRELDPQLVKPSRWANRDEASFADKDFDALKTDIAAAGRNVQPIKVRPVPAGGFEIIFGHRRHRACLELGLPVHAVVDAQQGDRGLWLEMERENRERKNLTALEQGRFYAKALDSGLFPSMRTLAQAIYRDVGDVSKALALAQLPQPVVDAFRSPSDLQFRHSKPLKDALRRDPGGMLKAAAELKGQGLPAAKVLERLTQVGVGRSNTPTPAALTFAPERKGTQLLARFDVGRLSQERAAALEEELRQLHAKYAAE